MVNTMLYKTWKSSVTTGDGDPVWQGAPLLGDTVTPNEVAAGVANATRLDITDVKYILDKTGKVVTSFIKEGKNVDLDFVAFVISMLGGLDSADADFDPERNALVVRAHARPPLRDCLSDVNTRNVTTGLVAKILSVMDNTAMTEGVITVPSKTLVVGNNILINPANADEGAWLLSRNGDLVATPRVLANDASTLDLAFEELPPDGEYVLMVKARSGASTDFAPATARRIVNIRAAV